MTLLRSHASTKTLSALITNNAIRVHINLNNIFLYRHSIIEISFAIEKLLDTFNYVLGNDALRIQ
ncbi:MAG: hypothetical protein C4528_04840 [Gammaproteobacteria bacterium]|nr:MAG: hypothetical protein C4528_04840 [Gammaproteobacteria bacterium]